MPHGSQVPHASHIREVSLYVQNKKTNMYSPLRICVILNRDVLLAIRIWGRMHKPSVKNEFSRACDNKNRR